MCMDQEFPAAKILRVHGCTAAEKLLQCNGMQGHICNYNIACTL